MSEATFKDFLRKNIKEYLPNSHFQAIETATNRGVPDVNLCVDGKELWLELKEEYGYMTGIRPEQRIWINERVAVGGTVLVLVRRKTAKINCIELYKGTQVDDLYFKRKPEPAIRINKTKNKWLDSDLTEFFSYFYHDLRTMEFIENLWKK